MELSPADALRRTHAWFEQHSGWAPPEADTVEEWLSDGVCRCPDECVVAPTQACPHGLASWWLVLVTLDRPESTTALSPERLAPHPGRLDPAAGASYVAAMNAHHRALTMGDAGYLDPISGLFVQTARSLWDRGSCCQQGCRHCPFIDR